MKDQAIMMNQISAKQGFFAALDQSGGSTPGHCGNMGFRRPPTGAMRKCFSACTKCAVRVMTAPSFTGDKIIGAILFEGTMDGLAEGKPVPAYLWDVRHIVPFLKVDKGLEAEKDGVRLMKPMPALDALLDRATGLGIFGTKMRSVINLPSPMGIHAIVDQQFAVAGQILKHGLVPILEPEVLINSPDKAGAENILLEQLLKGLDALTAEQPVLLKLTLPEVPDHYAPLIHHKRVARVVALSGGYALEDACKRLAMNHDVIASFSRALLDELKQSMSDAEFDATLATVIDKIYQASTLKH